MRNAVIGCLSIALAACGSGSESRPFDTSIQCGLPSTPAQSLEEALLRVDRDGDGLMTDADLRAGEAMALVRVDGTHGLSGEVSSFGVTIHSDLFPEAPDVPGAQSGLCMNLHCFPEASICAWYDTSGSGLEKGPYPFLGMAVGVFSHELQSERETAEGVFRVTNIGSSTISGYLEGGATSPLYTRIPDEEPTGQTVIIEGLAFRDIRRTR